MRKRLPAIVGGTAAVIVGLAVVAVVATGASSQAYRISSSSMEPTYHCARPGPGCSAGHSDRVVVSRVLFWFRKPHPGDVVAFHTPPLTKQRCGAGGVYIKRIVAVGGETWEERNGVVLVDGKRLEEPYVKRGDAGAAYPKRTVPKGRYFVLGDNRSQSCDSREWGALKRSAIIGPVIATYWPPGRWSLR